MVKLIATGLWKNKSPSSPVGPPRHDRYKWSYRTPINGQKLFMGFTVFFFTPILNEYISPYLYPP